MNKMYRIALLIVAVLVSLPVSADMIIKKDGTVLTCYNVEELGKWVLYTEEPSADSNLKRISVEEVFGIKTDDGEIKAVGQSATAVSEPAEKKVPQTRKALPTPDNAELIAQYNTVRLIADVKEKPGKMAKDGNTTIWGIGSDAVLSDEVLSVAFLPLSPIGDIHGYEILLVNKTDNNVYVDLTNSFRMDGTGMAVPFFENATYTTTSGGGSGASMNVGAVTSALGVGGVVGTLAGGLNVGGGSNSSTQVTKSEQPVLLIPPHASVAMPKQKMMDGKDVKEIPEVFQFTNHPNPYSVTYASLCGYGTLQKKFRGGELRPDVSSITATSINLVQNGFVEFPEAESPKTYRYLISYSTSKDFDGIVRLEIPVYLRGMFGAKLDEGHGLFHYVRKWSADGPLLWGYGHVPEK